MMNPKHLTFFFAMLLIVLLYYINQERSPQTPPSPNIQKSNAQALYNNAPKPTSQAPENQVFPTLPNHPNTTSTALALKPVKELPLFVCNTPPLPSEQTHHTLYQTFDSKNTYHITLQHHITAEETSTPPEFRPSRHYNLKGQLMENNTHLSTFILSFYTDALNLANLHLHFQGDEYNETTDLSALNGLEPEQWYQVFIQLNPLRIEGIMDIPSPTPPSTPTPSVHLKQEPKLPSPTLTPIDPEGTFLKKPPNL